MLLVEQTLTASTTQPTINDTTYQNLLNVNSYHQNKLKMEWDTVLEEDEEKFGLLEHI